jgi:hypothetical protein
MVLIFQILLGVGIAGFLFIAIKKIPVLLNYPRHSFEETSIKQRVQEKIQKLKHKTTQNIILREAIIPKTEKSLRKFNLFILKLHNLLTKITGHLKKKKEEQEKQEGDGDNFDLPS